MIDDNCAKVRSRATPSQRSEDLSSCFDLADKPMKVSLFDQLIKTKNRPSGFDYLRLGLSTAIILHHSQILTLGSRFAVDEQPVLMRIVIASLLPMFFALSGFLVAGSYERSHYLPTFLGLRAIRIFPALTAEVTLSALVLGPLFTTILLREYITNSMFWHYFLNIAGDVHFYLPGMFPNNPVPNRVNNQLWTIPFELKCYIGLSVVAVVGLLKRKYCLLFAVIVLQEFAGI